MGSSEREIREQYRGAQQEVAQLHSELKDLDTEDEGFPAGYARLVHGTRRLLRYEDELPRLLAEPARERSELMVLWSWRGQVVLALVMIVLVLVQDHALWWLPLLVLHLLGALAGTSQKVTAYGHLARRNVALVGDAASILTLLILLSVVPSWCLALVLAAWIVIAFAAASLGAGKAAA
ncbi:hypothetical protein ACWGJ2_33045 [Streptomyces sp. NPDC054796]